MLWALLMSPWRDYGLCWLGTWSDWLVWLVIWTSLKGIFLVMLVFVCLFVWFLWVSNAKISGFDWEKERLLVQICGDRRLMSVLFADTGCFAKRTAWHGRYFRRAFLVWIRDFGTWSRQARQNDWLLVSQLNSDCQRLAYRSCNCINISKVLALWSVVHSWKASREHCHVKLQTHCQQQQPAGTIAVVKQRTQNTNAKSNEQQRSRKSLTCRVARLSSRRLDWSFTPILHHDIQTQIMIRQVSHEVKLSCLFCSCEQGFIQGASFEFGACSGWKEDPWLGSNPSCMI